MEKILIIANWKMNPNTPQEARRLFNSVRKEIRGVKNSETVFCPPFVYLSSLKISKSLSRAKSRDRNVRPERSRRICLGAQDCFWQESGAYTGEISPAMLKNLGCQYVICGHSERRDNLAETDEMVNRKVRASLSARLQPILCVGEKSRHESDYEKFIQNEVILGLKNVSRGLISDMIIAYEPIWAIGSGKPATPDDALSVGLLIKKTLVGLYGRPLAEKVKIIYGGSVTSQNAKNYTIESSLGGLLVGGASLNDREFIKIVRSFE